MSEQVNNHDIVGLYQRLNRFIEELYKSASSGVSEVNEFDQARLTTYLNAVDTYHAWVINQPHLDCPETAPRYYDLDEPPVVDTVENENVNDLIRILLIARDELVNAQSARTPANLNPFDSARLTAIVQKCRLFLLDYIQVATPLDLPESSPEKPQSGPGRTGI